MGQRDEDGCACRSWVRMYGVGLPGERHHRDCQHWYREHNAEVFQTRTELIVTGWPDPQDENHNCDALGCTSVSHVLFRFPLPTAGVPATDCTEPNRAACPRRCMDFCNKAEAEREGELPPGVGGTDGT